MKKLTTTLRLLTLAALLQAQPFTASLTPQGMLAIADPQAPQSAWPYDTIAVSFTLTGPSCTAWWQSGKQPQSSAYLLTLPASYPAQFGFAVRKTTHRGRLLPDGTVKWQVAQSGECLALVLPAPPSVQVDTTYLQPITVQVAPGTYAPDWHTPVVQGGSVAFEPTPLQPFDVKLEGRYIIGMAGILADASALAPGLYFAVSVLDWQGMTFVETDEFIVN